jgi:hypothetical protein
MSRRQRRARRAMKCPVENAAAKVLLRLLQPLLRLPRRRQLRWLLRGQREWRRSRVHRLRRR